MTSIQVWTQADLVSVRMTLVPDKQAGTLETLVLRAIRGGADTRDDLAEIFGLALRLVDDVLGDLWRVGRITVDLDADVERIRLTSDALDELASAEQRGEELRSGSQRAHTEQVAVDRLTGRALPFFRTQPYPKERKLVVPAMTDDPKATKLDRGQLVEALSDTLRRTAADAPETLDHFKVDEVYLAPDVLQAGTGRRYVPLRILVSKDATDGLLIHVVDDALQLPERELATKRLQRLVEDQRDSTFATHLRGAAGREPLEERSVHQVVTRLREVVGGLQELEPAQRQAARDRATYLAGQVDAYARNLQLQEMDTEVVRTGERHVAVIHAMLDDARRQVAMSVPWVRVRGLQEFRNSMFAAVGRGVQISLLWGIAEGPAELDQETKQTLDAVNEVGKAAGRGGGIFYSRDRGSRIHAKVVVADDRRLLVTSKNFLSGSQNDELGMLLTAVAGRPNPAAEEVLQFLYDRAPDPAMAYRLIRSDFRDHDGAVVDEQALLPVPLPRLTARLLEERAPAGQVAAWVDAWREVLEVLAARIVRPRPTVEVLTDGLHSALVRDALRNAQERLVVTSDRVSAQALNAEIVELLERRAAGGLGITVRYAKCRDDESEQIMRRLEASRTPQLDVRQNPRMHAKVVIRDDVVVLGSFNHLSVDAAVRRHRATGELSVRVASAEVAAEVAEAIDAAPVDVPGPGRDPDGTARAGVVATSAAEGASLVLGMLDALQPLDGPPDVAAAIALVRDAPEDAVRYAVSRLDPLSPRPEDQQLTAVILEALYSRPDAAADLVRSVTVALLGSTARAGAWACAAVLRNEVEDPAVEPRPLVTAVLAARSDRAGTLWSAATDAVPPRVDEVDVLRTSTCAGLLFGEITDPEVVGPLAAWDGIGDTGGLAAAALAYWTRFGALPEQAPQPYGETPAGPDRGVLAWTSLAKAVEDLRRYDSHSDVGEAVSAYLFAGDGEMTELAELAGRRDEAALRAWQAEHAGQRNDSRWLDKVTKAAGQSPIDTNRRVSFTSKRRTIRVAVAAALAATSAPDGADPGPDLPAEQVQAIESLRAAVRTMRTEIASSSGLTPLDGALRRDIERLARWCDGAASGEPAARGAALDAWMFPHVRLVDGRFGESGAAHPDPAAHQNAVRAAMLTDLAGRWTPADVVGILQDGGEFGSAEAAVDELVALREVGTVDHDDAFSAEDLREQLAAARARALADLHAEVQELRFRCDRLGVTDDRVDAGVSGLVGDSDARSRRYWDEVESDVGTAAKRRGGELRALLDRRRASMDPLWVDHVSALLAGEELALAAQALDEVDGRPFLPRPTPTPRWSWRGISVATASRWMRGEGEDVPRRILAEFIPGELDPAGRRVVAALHGLAAADLDDLDGSAAPALREWLLAVQALVAETDTEPPAGTAQAGIATQFVLPFDQRLPRLEWAGTGPVDVTVGRVAEPAALHFAVEVVDHSGVAGDQPSAVIDVSDVLSLLGREHRYPTSISARSLQFLSMIGSRLPLRRVIAPSDVPTGRPPDRRMALAWLLAILGFSVQSRDLDLLRVLGGCHPVPMWHLIEAARENPLEGLAQLRRRADLDDILRRGLRADLADDEALLVLATVLKLAVTDRDEIRTAVEVVFDEHDGDVLLSRRIDIDGALDRLSTTGHLAVDHRELRTCTCMVTSALVRDVDAVLADVVGRVDATIGLQERAFDEVLALAMHNAKDSLLSEEEIRTEAWKDMRTLMSSTAPVDLRTLCRDRVRRVEADDVDLIWTATDDAPLLVPGPRIWVDCLVTELLNNAVAATRSVPHADVGSVYLELTADGEAAELTVADDGPGFPRDVLDAFAAGRPARRAGRPGHGNGLDRCRRAAMLHDVGITLEAGADGGSVVRVRFPLASTGEE